MPSLRPSYYYWIVKHVWSGRKEIEENAEKYIVTNMYFETQCASEQCDF